MLSRVKLTKMATEKQLPLAIGLDVEARFDTFLTARNQALVDSLQSPVAPGLWVAGLSGSGRSHLLQAVAAARQPGQVFYLPLAIGLPPAGLDGLPETAIVCLDDVDAVADSEAWQRALLSLFEALLRGGGVMICSAHDRPAQCGFVLADWISRCEALAYYRLKPLDDDAQLEALKMRAGARGLTLPEETAQHLTQRMPRDLAVLLDWLTVFDRRSLAAKRHLTVPFVRSVLRDGSLQEQLAAL